MKLRVSLLAAALLAPGCGSTGSDTATAPSPTDASVQGDVSSDDSSLEAHADATPSDVLPKDGGQDTAPDDGVPDAKPPVTYVNVVMAGDVAEDGRTQHAKAAAALIAGRTPAVDAVVLLGDNARYDPLKLMTVLSYYNKYYKPESEGNWGQFDSISFPQMGNHEYMSLNPQGYIDYFQTRMTAIKALPDYSGFIDDKARGYYSFDLGGWHFVSLNANCTGVSGGCKAGSAQEQWLKADLEAHPNQPIIAGFHNPRWACGGSHASDEAMQPFWADLYDAGADFVFVGHDHYYQRWKPLDKTSPEAAIDTANGLTEIVVGSYGVSPYDVCDPAEPRVSEQAGGEAGMGVFFLKLGSDGSYAFEYVLRSDGSIFDSGAGMSHHAP